MSHSSARHMTSFTVRLTSLIFRQRRAWVEEQYTMGDKSMMEVYFPFLGTWMGSSACTYDIRLKHDMRLTWNVINYHTVCTPANTQREVADIYEKRSFQFTKFKAWKYWPSTGFQGGRDPLSNYIIRPLRRIKINKH